MTLREKFSHNLALAREDFPDKTLEQKLQAAAEWTLRDVENHITQMVAHELAGRDEAVNKAFYDN